MANSSLLARFYIREVSDVAGQPLVIVGAWRRGAVQEGARVSVGSSDMLWAPVVITRLDSRPDAQGGEAVTITFEIVVSPGPDPEEERFERDFHRDMLSGICTQGSTIGIRSDDDDESGDRHSAG